MQRSHVLPAGNVTVTVFTALDASPSSPAGTLVYGGSPSAPPARIFWSNESVAETWRATRTPLSRLSAGCGIVSFHSTSMVAPDWYVVVGTVVPGSLLLMPPQPLFAMVRASANGCNLMPVPVLVPARGTGEVRMA